MKISFLRNFYHLFSDQFSPISNAKTSYLYAHSQTPSSEPNRNLSKNLFSPSKKHLCAKKREGEQNRMKRDLGWKAWIKKSSVCRFWHKERERRETERIDSYTAGLARRWYARVIRYNRIMRAAICGRKSGRSRPRLEHSVFCGLPWGTRIRL